MRVDPGERFGLECVSTEVFYGDTRLPAREVRTDVERGAADNTWVVRVTAAAPVVEPIVEVALSAGCDHLLTRRFTLFADPASLAPAAVQLPQLAPAPDALAPGPTTGQADAIAPGSASGARAARHDTGAGRATRPHGARKGHAMAMAPELQASPPPAVPPPARRGASAASAGPRSEVPAPVEAPRLVLDAGVAHLKLDMEEPIVPLTSAASGAATGLSDLDDPETRQLRVLEQDILAVRRETQAQHVQAAKLEARLAAAQARGDWLPWLLGLLAIALAAIAALLWKLRQHNRIAHSAWFDESQMGALAPTAPVPVAAAEPPAEGPSADLRDGASAPGASAKSLLDTPQPDDSDARGVAPLRDPSATRPLARHSMAAVMPKETGQRELSVEELLDLEQQADFFIALGQEDAAVDLLMSHLRSAGGQSPLPYTKLLEIYRRQGDRSAYERTRARFNRRFNAYAPDWDTGPTAGRTLEDYPDTVALLERAWHSPIDAMTILEGLLFKRDDSGELFDLPAYRDVLVLYSMARDVWQHGDGNAGTQVDVLLPLDANGHAESPVPYPSARENNEVDLPLDDAGLDLHSVDVEGDTRSGMLTSFELPGLEPAQGAGGDDRGRPHGDGDVHATLDEMSLVPAAPSRPKPAPDDWHDVDPGPAPGSPPRR